MTWLKGIRTREQLAGLDLLPPLRARLSGEQRQRLNEHAPASLPVPSGHRVTLDYGSGDIPILAVKLQEMFGLADTPKIAGGRVKVLLHLLSPARKPVQVTQDLKGFWDSGYQQVKKELKGRYPKHPWPDDPWKAVPQDRPSPQALNRERGVSFGCFEHRPCQEDLVAGPAVEGTLSSFLAPIVLPPKSTLSRVEQVTHEVDFFRNKSKNNTSKSKKGDKECALHRKVRSLFLLKLEKSRTPAGHRSGIQDYRQHRSPEESWISIKRSRDLINRMRRRATLKMTTDEILALTRG